MNKKTPELLTHPNIPQPLHGVNSRTSLGQDWWDAHRKIAYAQRDYHCWACGVHKSLAKYHRWLEGHEAYRIDYEAGLVKVTGIVALCHSCHNFIHSGRLWALYKKGEIGQDKITDVLRHGFKIIRVNQLKPYWGSVYIWGKLKGMSQERMNEVFHDKLGWPTEPPKNDGFAPWSEWRLVIANQTFYSRFESQREWREFYSDD